MYMQQREQYSGRHGVVRYIYDAAIVTVAVSMLAAARASSAMRQEEAENWT